MAQDQRKDKIAGVSDAAVLAKTGKSWSEWFAILDAADATKMTHAEIAAYLHEQHRVSPWWSQTITVGYEQERGLREKHETPDGFQVSVSRTIGVPVRTLFYAWHDDGMRARWLPEQEITVRKAVTDKSMRLAWGTGRSPVDVRFYAKGASKSQVVVLHSKLPSADEVTRLRDFWSGSLDRLRDLLQRRSANDAAGRG